MLVWSNRWTVLALKRSKVTRTPCASPFSSMLTCGTNTEKTENTYCLWIPDHNSYSRTKGILSKKKQCWTRPYKFYCCGVRSNVKKKVWPSAKAKTVGLWAVCLKDFWTIFQRLSSVTAMWRTRNYTRKTSMTKNYTCSCALHSMHIIICGDAVSHPLSITFMWSNNYHVIWIDVTNLPSLIVCYIQAILVPTLKTKTQSSHPPDLLCLADDARCMLCAQAFVFNPKLIEMLLSLIMNLHNIVLNLPHQISCSYRPFWDG